MPKVSILSPTYNHEKYVTQAIESVLAQTFSDFELIITDDASTDRNVDFISKFADKRITLLRNNHNQGTTSASTRCWQYSNGEYIIGLATDDIYEPHLLETLVKYLDSDPEAVGAFGLASFIDDDSNLLNDEWTKVGVGQDRFGHLRQLFKLQHPFCPVTGMFRRSVLEKLGYFPSYLRQTNDMAQFVRLLFYGEMPILPEKLLRYRWRANNANVSSRTPENDARLDFELFEILDLYREYIKSTDLLRKIFPEVDQHFYPLTDDLIPFHLAQIAISFNYTAHRLYGMHILYQMLKDDTIATQLNEQCQFTYTDFFKLAGEHPLIMNKSLRDEIDWLRSENVSLKKTIEELAQEIQNLQLAQSNNAGVKYRLKKKFWFVKSWLNALRQNY
jgi:glycosyltransferase involved in cell wall biosynthesis